MPPLPADAPPRSAVLVLSAAVRGAKWIGDAAADAALSVVLEANFKHAEEWLEGNRPRAIVVAQDEAEAACLRIRFEPELARIPILGSVDAPGDLHFAEFFGWGGDDLTLAGDVTALARRLRALALAGAAAPAHRRGIAVVGESDDRWRVLLARVLRGAGYDVTFAFKADELVREAAREGVALVVSSSRLEQEETALLPARVRAAGISVPWVVAVAPKELARMRSSLRGVAGVAVYDAFGPPENVLFVANELMRGRAAEGRASVRLLYGAVVRFRTAGAEHDDVGYSFNVSAGGMYIRTLAPLPHGADAWLELRPPRSDRHVRLEGRVVWSRPYGPNDAATVPPGFGVQISGGSIADIERFIRGYNTFAAEMLAT